MIAVTHEDQSPEACLKTDPFSGFRELNPFVSKATLFVRVYTTLSLLRQKCDRFFRVFYGLLPRQEDRLEEVAVGLRTQAGLGSHKLLHVAGEALHGGDRDINIYI